MFCSNCGNQLQDQVKFCSSCGNSISNDLKKEEDLYKSKNNNTLEVDVSEKHIEPMNNQNENINNPKDIQKLTSGQYIENTIFIILGLLLVSIQGFDYLVKTVIVLFFDPCNSEIIGPERCLPMRDEPAMLLKEVFWWVWFLIILSPASQMIRSFKHLRAVSKSKEIGSPNSCSECDFSPISWEATSCPNCSNPNVNPQITGHEFTLYSHIFFIYACIHYACYPFLHS